MSKLQVDALALHAKQIELSPGIEVDRLTKRFFQLVADVALDHERRLRALEHRCTVLPVGDPPIL